MAIIFIGEFGVVYKGIWKTGGRKVPVAVKTPRVSKLIV
jgi:hypothetical protein